MLFDDHSHPVAQPSSAASSGTVPVPEPGKPPTASSSIETSSNPLFDGFHFRGVLPHLKKEGGTYFVTFRQAGTLPKEVLLQFKGERDAIVRHASAAKRPLTWHEQEELFRWYSNRVDDYLDAGHGICYLGDPELAELVAGAIRFFDGLRYEVRAFVVMPNHVHAVVWPTRGNSLSQVLHSWKSYTSHEINNRLPKRVVPFWQSESYEHLIRDDDDLHRCIHYTVVNPVNARLCSSPEDWRWSSLYVAQPFSAASSGTVPVPDPQTQGGPAETCEHK